MGRDLREARMRRGDDLVVVAHALRIRKDQVAAIEENRLDDLPGRTYAIGFIRSYAAWLGLDAREYVERFKAENPSRTEHVALKGLPEDTGSRLPYGWLFMALLVLGVVGYAGYHLVRSAEFTPLQQAVAPVPAVMSPELGRHATPKRPVHAQQQTNIVSRPGATAAAANANPSVPAAGTTLKPAPSSTPAAAPDPALAALPSGQVYGTQNHKARVVLHARTVTHVLVEGPGGRVYINRILHPGDAYRVPDLVGLSLTTPDGGAVLLELDGQDMGVAGRTGQMTEALSLDPQAIVDRAHGGNPG
ncbi:MAG TPA: helix-turn-helix domain-containing protein [Rhizomicrobium sp.]|nr:helix-turn-helix domain-containing protein [Rhizomicrobium sp.]